MFLGTHTPRLDDKGRLILPAKFRDELAGGVVITKGQERCLYVFPIAEFSRIAAELRAAADDAQGGPGVQPGVLRQRARRGSRQAGPGHHPGASAEYAGLDRDLVVIGASTRVEIWDKTAWEAYLAESEDDFADIEEGVLPGGL